MKSKPIEGYKVVRDNYTVMADGSKFGVGVKIKAKNMKRPIEESFCNVGGVHFFVKPWQYFLFLSDWGYSPPGHVFHIRVLSKEVAHHATKSVCKELIGLEELDITDWELHKQEWLGQASKHEDWYTRFMVTIHPNTSISTLKRLAKDPDKNVRSAAKANLKDRKKER